ncbi:MAG: hypothetical protein K9K76_11390 [Halanaerobiales bacterium]|nr:hypothetical protein [Halanaerobiales bacterium]
MAKSITRIKRIKIDVVKNNEVEEKEVIVSKAPLGNWKRLTDSIQKLMNLLPEVLEEKGLESQEELEQYFDQMTMQDILLLLPDMMEVAFEETMNLLSIGTDKDAKFMEKYAGMDEAIDIFEAIVEVNNLVKVVEKGKNLMNLLSRKRPQK